MGIQGLWQLAKPAAREITLDELKGAKVALDSALWISQFESAGIDLVVGFYNRLERLLYHGILIVVVFEGSGCNAEKKRTQLNRQITRGDRLPNTIRSTLKSAAKDFLSGKLPISQPSTSSSIDWDLDCSVLEENDKEFESPQKCRPKDDLQFSPIKDCHRQTSRLKRKRDGGKTVGTSNATVEVIDLPSDSSLSEDEWEKVEEEDGEQVVEEKITVRRTSNFILAKQDIRLPKSRRIEEGETLPPISKLREDVDTNIDQEGYCMRQLKRFSERRKLGKDAVWVDDDSWEEEVLIRLAEETEDTVDGNGKELLERITVATSSKSLVSSVLIHKDHTPLWAGALEELNEERGETEKERNGGEGTEWIPDHPEAFSENKMEKKTMEKASSSGEHSDLKTLLSLLGIPYIEAPGEAEAQCAQLVHKGLCEFTATEDSDILALGGGPVLRDLCGEKPIMIDTKEMEKRGITRYVCTALSSVVGCDYTEGIMSMGVVNGLELLGELREKEWPAVNEASFPECAIEAVNKWIGSDGKREGKTLRRIRRRMEKEEGERKESLSVPSQFTNSLVDSSSVPLVHNPARIQELQWFLRQKKVPEPRIRKISLPLTRWSNHLQNSIDWNGILPIHPDIDWSLIMSQRTLNALHKLTTKQEESEQKEAESGEEDD